MSRYMVADNPARHLAPMALAVILFYAAMMGPAHVVMALAAAPMYYAYARHGRKYGFTTALGAASAVWIISGGAWALAFTAICALMALTAAEAHVRGFSLGLSVTLAAALPFVAATALLAVTSGSQALTGSADEIAQTSVEALMDRVEKKSGRAPALSGPSAPDRKTMVWAISSIFPALTFNTAIFLALAHYLFSRALSLKMGWGIHLPGHNLATWSAPGKLAWALAAGIALSLSGPHGAPAAIGLNITLVAGMVYALHGLSIVHHWMESVMAPAPVRALALALALLALPWAYLLLGALGLTDAMADFRRLKGQAGGHPQT